MENTKKSAAPYQPGDQVLALFGTDLGTSYGPLTVSRIVEIAADGRGRRWRVTAPRPNSVKHPIVEWTVYADGRDTSGYVEPRPLDEESSASRQHYIDTGSYLYAGEAQKA